MVGSTLSVILHTGKSFKEAFALPKTALKTTY